MANGSRSYATAALVGVIVGAAVGATIVFTVIPVG